jgi:hypothetical protein
MQQWIGPWLRLCTQVAGNSEAELRALTSPTEGPCLVADDLSGARRRAGERRQGEMSWRNTLLLVTYSVLVAAATTIVIRFIVDWIF